jgi:hypothetical protein
MASSSVKCHEQALPGKRPDTMFKLLPGMCAALAAGRMGKLDHALNREHLMCGMHDLKILAAHARVLCEMSHAGLGHCLHDEAPEVVHQALLPWLLELHGKPAASWPSTDGSSSTDGEVRATTSDGAQADVAISAGAAI